MSSRLLIDVNNISLVLVDYDQIQIHRSDTEGGAYVEITDANTRINIIPEQTKYYFTDPTGDETKWYKIRYYHSTAFTEGQLSAALQGGTEQEKIGYSFGNYAPPPNEWGKVLTADDIRYTYMFGIDAIAEDEAESEFSDAQFDFFVEQALSDFERELSIDIRKKVYKTNPVDTLTRGPKWREGVDYTDEEDPYDFSPDQWANYGFLQLRHRPLLSVERAELLTVVGGTILDLVEQNWVRMVKKYGQLNFFPTQGVAYGPFNVMGNIYRAGLGGGYPQGYEIDYTTGLLSARFVPDDLRGVIGMWATIKALNTVGDGLLAGFSSQSVSLDGLSESFSSTQSATSAYFGARIKVYVDQVDTYIKRNRNKHSIPLSFTGGT